MSKIKVSIIVPVYNVQEYIEECINSLIGQTLKDIEIVLVDDGSTDNSGKICDDYSKKDCRIKVIHKNNGGQSAARNKGLMVAQGEYVLFVDSDDWIVPETCEVLFTEAKQGDSDIVHGDMFNERERVIRDREFRWIPCEGKVVPCLRYLKEAIKKCSYDIVVYLNLIRKEYILTNELYFHEGCFYEDQEYSLKLFTANGGKGTIKKIRFPYYYYRFNPDSTTNSTTLKKVEDILIILTNMVEYIENYCDADDESNSAMKSTASICMYHLGSFYAKLSKDDYKIMNVKLKSSKELLKNVASWKGMSRRIEMQNRLFVINPRMNTVLLRIGKIIKCK